MDRVTENRVWRVGTGGLVDLDLGQVIRITMVIRSISFIGFVSMPVFMLLLATKHLVRVFRYELHQFHWVWVRGRALPVLLLAIK